jgi:nucleotide-binding universal stress UspA family protein
MKILLPVDGSAYTKRMLAFVAANPEFVPAGSELLFLTVVAPLPSRAVRFLDASACADHYAEQAAEVFKPVLAFANQQGWRFTSRHAHGHAAEVIAQVADEARVDLVVMGSHGHGSIGNMVLGSVSTGVLARTTVPVLLIRR